MNAGPYKHAALVLMFSTLPIGVAVAQNDGEAPPASMRVTLPSDRFGGGFRLVTLDVSSGEAELVAGDLGPAADPSWSNDGLRLAFAADRGGVLQIMSISADGGQLTQLTNTTGRNLQPAWSQDGKKIVFTSERTGNHELFVMNADGTDQVNLTNHAAYDADAAWSPDSSRIVFASNRGGGSFRLHVMNADGLQPRELVDRDLGGWLYPAWSPDGAQIVFSGILPDGTSQLFVCGSNGQGVEQLTADGGANTYGAWSPDGRYIAWIHFEMPLTQSPPHGRLKLMDVETLEITEFKPEELRFGGSRISWLPLARTPGQSQ